MLLANEKEKVKNVTHVFEHNDDYNGTKFQISRGIKSLIDILVNFQLCVGNVFE